MRALAQRSASAAKEIKSLIEQSVGKAQEGMNMAQSAGDKVKQSSGVSQVNIAVNQMDQVTQQNAVLVE